MLDQEKRLKDLNQDWKIVDGALHRLFKFKGYYKTISFVNAIAYIANKQVHHPDLEVSYSSCLVKITTHDEGNTLTEKDFNLAKAIDNL